MIEQLLIGTRLEIQPKLSYFGNNNCTIPRSV